MRVLGITETCDLGSMYRRLLAEGHQVRASISNPLASGTMAGLVPRSSDWRSELGWIREAGDDGIIVFEAIGFGELQDKLRGAGFNVVGGSAFGDRLENDRAAAQRQLAELGLNTASTTEFADAEEAFSDLAIRPRRCVLKMSASAGDTFVGVLPDGRDVSALLRVKPPVAPFILMDYVEGIEVGVGAFFNGTNFLRPACLDWEHKHFFPGDLGELTGEMGTVATFEWSDAIFNATLAKLESGLRSASHVGWVNLNLIINEQGIWPLEFTCRFGYPGFAVLEPLQGINWGDLLHGLCNRSLSCLPTRPGFSVGVVISTPPFPLSRAEVDSAIGLPIVVDDLDDEHLHLGEAGIDKEQLVTSGLYGWTAVVTGTGSTVDQAQRAAYDRVRKVVTPNMRYRQDIGNKLARWQLQQLADWGWMKSVPSSLMASQIVR
ncbi:phosphoribosylglycinamide synthetase C domain-containing protein [Sphingomonas daechungensis]